jgi:DNA-binding NtrC family response regulator
MAHICVIDDKAPMRDSVTAALERAGHTVVSFADPVQALSAIRRSSFELVLTDLKMPNMDGLSLIRALRESRCDVPIIVMTAFGTVATAVEAMRVGAFDFVQKPFEADSLTLQIDRALEHQKLCIENEALRTSLGDVHRGREMIGDSEAMQTVRSKIAQYVAGDATVLITGESGTGKELAAAAIHAASPRGKGHMLCLNCAALSGNLLESELFGHERGAFTGADRMRKGRFELADGGTLLLDEISEMALPLQAKLLRVLQEGEFERVGSSATIRADVRVIATTNRMLEDWIQRKRFREDLFYRLNVLPLQLPALRDRSADIPILVGHFLEKMAIAAAKTPLEVDSDAMDRLCEYRWPGNIRELENVCQRASVTVTDGVIRAADVGQWLGRSGERGSGFEQLRPGRMLQDMERQLIERTLKQFNGHRAKSAKALGMGIRTLGLKLKQWREADAARSESVEYPVGV